MLGKLLKYDFGALAKILGPMQLVAVGVIFLASVSGFVGYWVNELSSEYMDFLQITAFAGVGMGLLALCCLIPATLVIVLYRFYSNFFTDQGYLTFTLPVKASELLWSKLIAGGVWILISSCVAMLGCLIINICIVGLTDSFDLADSIPYWILNVYVGWGTFEDDLLGFVFAIIGFLISLASVLMVAFLSLTLGATWAKQHKLASGILLFIGISCATNIFFGMMDFFVLFEVFWDLDSGMSSAVGMFIYGLHILRDVVLCVGGFCLTWFCLHKRLNLR